MLYHTGMAGFFLSRVVVSPVAFLLGVLAGGAAVAAPISIMAAESVYGGIAARIAGPAAVVTSILSNPAQDPHAFEPSPGIARDVAAAQIVIGNGAGYDGWLDKLIAANPSAGRSVISVAGLMHRTAEQNPHVWYNPRAITALAAALTVALSAADPGHAAKFEANRDALFASLLPLESKIGVLRAQFHGVPVAATEPVFGEMAGAIGLVMTNERFQLAVMNGSEPRPSDIARFEDDLQNHRVRLLIYNTQTESPTIARLREVARGNGILVVGVSETQPAGQSYEAWMMAALDQLDGLTTPDFRTLRK